MNFLKNFLTAFIGMFIFTLLAGLCIVLPALLTVECSAWFALLYLVTAPALIAFFGALDDESKKEENKEDK